MNDSTTCGARTRAGTPCRRSPTPGKARCRLHGGLSTGPRTPAETHGIYAGALPAEEVAAVTGADAALVDELLVARVQLRRALRAWERWSVEHPEALPVEEQTTTENPQGQAVTIRRRRPDLWAIIDRCLGRIGRLTEQRARVEEVRELEARLEALAERLETEG